MSSESPATPTKLFAALVAAQLDATPVPKGADFDAGGKFGYKYAASPDVVRYARKLLHDHGLALVINGTTAVPGEGPRGVVTLSGFLFHSESGEVLPVSFALPYVGSKGRPDDKASQASITTGEARMYRLLLGLTTLDPEDEVASGGPVDESPTAQPPPTAAAKPPAPKTAAKPPAPKPKTQEAKDAEERAALDGPDGAPGASSADECEEFAAIAKRLGLDLDTAVTWAGRMPAGAKMKDNPKMTVTNNADAVKGGKLAALTVVLNAEIDSLKARKIHPVKSGWSKKVKEWSADALNF